MLKPGQNNSLLLHSPALKRALPAWHNARLCSTVSPFPSPLGSCSRNLLPDLQPSPHSQSQHITCSTTPPCRCGSPSSVPCSPHHAKKWRLLKQPRCYRGWPVACLGFGGFVAWGKDQTLMEARFILISALNGISGLYHRCWAHSATGTLPFLCSKGTTLHLFTPARSHISVPVLSHLAHLRRGSSA